MAYVVAPPRGREGSRWINERPSPEQVAEWFKTVPLDEDMSHEKYVAGITLIQSFDKGDKIVGYDDNSMPVVAERKDVVFTPYMKVDARLAYLRELVDKRDGWRWVLEPVHADHKDPLGLPPGFFRYQALKPDGKVAAFVGKAVRLRILGNPEHMTLELGDSDNPWRERAYEGDVIADVIGTKIVPTATRWDVDPNALHKAETGAVGRALGLAGILVLPGSGIATAEDMQEALSNTGTGAIDPAQAAQLPAEPAAGPAPPPEAAPAAEPPANTTNGNSDTELRRHAAALIRGLEDKAPDKVAEFRTWAKERGHGSLNELVSPALRGVVRKLEKMADEAGVQA